jgi:RNA polymerase sigma-54 factor
MGPAIAIRLRQHLTLTPQVQQALRLLQMSAMEFAQEMEQCSATNPFLEENRTRRPRPDASVEEVSSRRKVREAARRARPEDWGGVSDTQPTLQEHLRDSACRA